MGWLLSFQGVYDSVVAAVLLELFLLVGGIMLAWWARVKTHLSLPFVVLIVMGFVALSLIIVNQLKALSGSRPSLVAVVPLLITTETPNGEIADRLRKWLDDFHLQVQVNNREEAHFSFIARGPSTIPIEVMRLKKEHEQFITALGLVVIGDDDRTKMNSLPEQQRLRILMEIKMELLRQKVVSSGNLLRGLQIENRVPVSELSQAKLMDQIDDIENAMALVLLRVRTLLDEQK